MQTPGSIRLNLFFYISLGYFCVNSYFTVRHVLESLDRINTAIVMRVEKLEEQDKYMEVSIQEQDGWFWRGRERVVRMTKDGTDGKASGMLQEKSKVAKTRFSLASDEKGWARR
jgi:hypothetical protein